MALGFDALMLGRLWVGQRWVSLCLRFLELPFLHLVSLFGFVVTSASP